MSALAEGVSPPTSGAFGVNYALRPHKFVDRRVFIEIINRFGRYLPLQNHVYVGLGSFAMEDHKLIHTTFGTPTLVSLEVNADVLARQKFNSPLSCIIPTGYSTDDFVARKAAIFRECGVAEDANAIIWFDMTDAETLRVYLNTFDSMLRGCQPDDLVRMTVDIDAKTLGRKADGETIEDLAERRFSRLREMLGEQLHPAATVARTATRLGIAEFVTHAFRLVAEQAFELDRQHAFEPLSLTTYADGHRMLSITGAVIRRDKVTQCREQTKIGEVPGGVNGWDDLVDIKLPQLTVWEKLSIDRILHRNAAAALTRTIDFRLHDTISTIDLLEGYAEFQRFYPTFRHVLL